MDTENRVKKSSKLLIILSTVIAVLSISLVKILNNGAGELSNILFPVIFVFVFSFIFNFYLDLNKKKLANIKAFVPVICLIYVIAVLGLEIPFIPIYISLFVLSVSLISYLVDTASGLIVLSGCLLYTFVFDPGAIGSVISAFLIAAILAVAVPQMKKSSHIVLGCEIVFSAFVIIRLFMNGFKLSDLLQLEIILELVYYLVVVIITYFIGKLLLRNNAAGEIIDAVTDVAADTVKEIDSSSDTETSASEAAVCSTSSEEDSEISELKAELESLKKEYRNSQAELFKLTSERRVTISEACSPDFELAEVILSDNPKVYKHSKQIAEYAMKAADFIGADSELAYAIGLFHEISKVFKNESPEQVLIDYHLPESIVQGVSVIKTVPTKPISREAGIVIIADEIKNTVLFAKNKGIDLSIDKIISNVLKTKKEQKLFALSGISVEEIQLIRMLFAEIIS